MVLVVLTPPLLNSWWQKNASKYLRMAGLQEGEHEVLVGEEEEDSSVNEDQLDPSSEDLLVLGEKAPKWKDTSTCSTLDFFSVI